MESIKVTAARYQYQILHVAVYVEPGKEFSSHEQYDALGREFESKKPADQARYATELSLCAALFHGYNPNRLDFIRRKNRIDQFQLKSFPGGAPQQAYELNELSRVSQQLKRTAEPFRKGLERMIRLHRHYPGSAFAHNSIVKLHERVGQEIANTYVVDWDIKGWLASLDGVKAWDPEAERRAKRKKLKEDIESGAVDYFLPGLPIASAGAKWVFAAWIGEGMGLASLWVQVDESGVVQDRIVRKDMEFTTEDLKDPRLWVSDPKNPEHIIPMEFYCQRKLQEQPEGKPNIVWTEKWEADWKALVYRLYTDYCPFGDVHSLIESNNMTRGKIPEAFMWMMFSALVDSGLVMERGGIINVPVDWKQIVHRDLKPMNIFLDQAVHHRWPLYPHPRMGDFGLAIETYPEDAGNPKRWKGLSGTRGYHAPEQLRLDERPLPEPHWQLLAHTNVWGTGRIMWDVLNHAPSFQSVMKATYRTDGTCELDVREAVQGLYSAQLLSTIRDCMHKDPKSRPTFTDLRRRIDLVMSAPPAGRQSKDTGLQWYMHNARNGSQSADEAHELHGLPGERYKLDMAFRNLKPRGGGGGPSVGAGASRR